MLKIAHVSVCENCEKEPATLRCQECDESVCADCDASTHTRFRMPLAFIYLPSIILCFDFFNILFSICVVKFR